MYIMKSILFLPTWAIFLETSFCNLELLYKMIMLCYENCFSMKSNHFIIIRKGSTYDKEMNLDSRALKIQYLVNHIQQFQRLPNVDLGEIWVFWLISHFTQILTIIRQWGKVVRMQKSWIWIVKLWTFKV